LTRKDGSVRILHIYGRRAPNSDDVITLPVDGKLISARVCGFRDTEQAGTKIHQAAAVEI